MMTDLASLLSANLAQPTAAASVAASGGFIAIAGQLDASLASAANPLAATETLAPAPGNKTATIFQAALAAQVQNLLPIDQPAPIKPGLAAYIATTTAANGAAAERETPALPSKVMAPTAQLAPAPVSRSLAGSTTIAMPTPAPIQTSLAKATAPVAQLAAPTPAVIGRPLPLSAPIIQPPALSTGWTADGKLPKAGNMLPIVPTQATPGPAMMPRAARLAGGASDDRPDHAAATPTGIADGSAPALVAQIAVAVQPASFGLTTATVTPAPVRRPATATARPIDAGTAAPPSLAVSPDEAVAAPAAQINPAALPGLMTLAPSVNGSSPVSPPSFGATQPPALAKSVPPRPAISIVLALVPVQLAPVSLAPAVPNSGLSGLPTPPQPFVTPLPAPATALANPVPPSLALASLSPPVLSIASRLARQPGVSRSVDPAAHAGDSASAPSLAVGALPVAPTAVSATSSATSPAPTPPQDFAALVDRLLEARASAQSSTTPQQISTSVTHADFGKISLNFQQDPAGLSVSMTSADPGFAHAAQSAIANSGPVGAGQSATADGLLSGHSGHQNTAGDFGQGFAPLNATTPALSATTGPSVGQNAGMLTAGGGSQQSQAQAQPQPRPGTIAAATRSPAAPGSTAASAADDTATTGIFA